MPEFRELRSGVYVFLQPPLIWHSTAGLIVGDREVIVVDSLTNAAMVENLRTEIRRVTDKPIRFLVNAHSHADHVYTNHLSSEAIIISTHRGRESTRANQKVQGEHDVLIALLWQHLGSKRTSSLRQPRESATIRRSRAWVVAGGPLGMRFHGGAAREGAEPWQRQRRRHAGARSRAASSSAGSWPLLEWSQGPRRSCVAGI